MDLPAEVEAEVRRGYAIIVAALESRPIPDGHRHCQGPIMLDPAGNTATAHWMLIRPDGTAVNNAVSVSLTPAQPRSHRSRSAA